MFDRYYKTTIGYIESVLLATLMNCDCFISPLDIVYITVYNKQDSVQNIRCYVEGLI